VEALLDYAPNGYLTFNDRGSILEINATLCSMLGYSKTELQGLTVETIFNIAGRIFFQTHFFPLLKMQTKVDEMFLLLLAKGGAIVPVVSSAVRTESDHSHTNVCAFLPVPNRRKYEEELLAAKRQAENALNENTALRSAKNETEVHAVELDKKIVRLDQINSELLQFNSIINHEMQECVRKILLFSKLAKTDTEEDYLGKIAATAERLKGINASLNEFINLGSEPYQKTTVDLNECLKQARAEVEERTGFKGLALHASTLPSVEGYFAELRLMFVQLIDNAVKFRKDNAVTVNVTAVIYADNIYKMSDRKYDYRDFVRLTIADNGKGFDNKHKEYVFALLKKLSRESVGNGIGLALCKKVLDLHQGSIMIESRENTGTSVQVVMPLKSY
jgi:sigma-B regulation protein RsbU (phosphoserine phosphatase)